MPDNSPVTKAELEAALATIVNELKEYIDERTRDLQTEVLRAFGNYQ